MHQPFLNFVPLVVPPRHRGGRIYFIKTSRCETTARAQALAFQFIIETGFAFPPPPPSPQVGSLDAHQSNLRFTLLATRSHGCHTREEERSSRVIKIRNVRGKRRRFSEGRRLRSISGQYPICWCRVPPLLLRSSASGIN